MQTRHKLSLALVVFALVMLSYWGLIVLAPGKIVVAVDAPLMSERVFDPSDMDAARLYFEENPDSRMQLKEMFYNFNPAQSAPGFEAAIDEGVNFFVTTQPSSTLTASAHLFANPGPLIINTSATSPSMTAKDDFMIRIIADAEQEQRTIADYINTLPGKNLLVLQDGANSAYTDPALRYFLKQLGTNPRWQVTHAKLQFEDFKPDNLTDQMGKPFDALYVLGGDFQASMGNIVQLFHRHHPNVPIVLTPWARSNTVFETAGPALRNIVLISNFPAKSKDLAIKDYLDRFTQRFGYQPMAMAIMIRQALEILEQAIAAGHKTPASVKKYLLSGQPLQTSLGQLQLNEFGDRTQGFYPISDLTKEMTTP